MIGTIRKHSKWLWWLIAGVTIISFVFFMGSGPGRGRGGGIGGEASLGKIYGQDVTDLEYAQAKNDFYLFYLINYGGWPDKDQSVTSTQIEQRTFVNILLARKAKSLGIAVSDQVVANVAAEMLSSATLNRAVGNRTGKPLLMPDFVEQILKPRDLTDADFQHFVRSYLVAEQLQQTMGLSGALVTPQEAGTLYDHDHQEVSAQVVFFSDSNYLSQVAVTPADVGQFFTNYMAYYREPDRVRVNYIWLNITNFVEQSKAEWAKTNFDATIDSIYRDTDPSQFGDAKTPEAAKDKIRQYLVQRRAFSDAADVARDFVTTLFAKDPVKLENFATVAKDKGLEARTSAPFSQDGGAGEFAHAPEVVKTAFALTADSPFSDAIPGEDGIYIIGLAAQLPSMMPSFDEIQAQVTQDYRRQEAIALARSAGTNFYFQATVQMAAGKTFAQAAVAKGFIPVLPAPFSLASTDIPEVGDHANVAPVKQAAFFTPVGRLSQFVSTSDGGFVLYVKSLSPADAAVKAAELPQYTSQIRRGRENEAFEMWVNSEATREFRNVPALQKPDSAAN